MAVHNKLTSDGERFLKELEELKRKEVRAGFHRGKKGKKSDGTPSQTDLVDIALYNELGTDTIPARPFLAQTAEQQGNTIKRAGCELVVQVVEGKMDAKNVLKQIGVIAQAAVSYQIENGTFKENKISTIKRKKSDQPLIDTGILKKSVRSKICNKGEYD